MTRVDVMRVYGQYLLISIPRGFHTTPGEVCIGYCEQTAHIDRIAI
ncbi:hypothetical protein bAD24_I04750 [Burkholderia sp. AD24]|nr:hypothetical protein bAD24_I04750 [Burkholderia sp. AD24]